MTNNPRNPALYAFLKQTMKGGVRTTREGEPCRYQKVVHDDGSMDLKIYSPGEEYAVCCPICGDKRFRCYINHKFDTEIEGVLQTHQVHCWNEECQQDRGLTKWLLDRYRMWKFNYHVPEITGVSNDVVAEGPMSVEEAAQESENRHSRLAGVQKLSSLLPGHPALEYLKSRGLSPELVESSYGVGYKGKSPKYNNAASRLIIPITWEQYEIGWQARAIPGHTRLTPTGKNSDWPYKEPKYFTSPGFTKGRFMYNLDKARDFNVVVMVEGITDVWKVGPWGVAMLGKRLSFDQVHLLVQSCSEKRSWIVMLTDAWDRADVADSWRKNFFDVMTAYPYKDRLRMLPLAKGDPGDYTGQELTNMVNYAMNSRQEDLVK